MRKADEEIEDLHICASETRDASRTRDSFRSTTWRPGFFNGLPSSIELVRHRQRQMRAFQEDRH